MSTSIVCDEFDGQLAQGVVRVTLCVTTLIIGAVLASKFFQAFNGKGNEREVSNITSVANSNDKLSAIEKAAKTEKNLKILALVGITASMFAAICYASFYIVGNVDCKNISVLSILLVLELTGTAVLNASLFITFVFRLLYCFEDTTYAPSKFTKLWYFTWITIIISMIIVAFCLFLFVPNFNGASTAIAILGIATFLYVVNCLILLFTFISKLSSMIQEFVNEFGVITDVQLNKLNKSMSIQIFDEDKTTLENAANDANLTASGKGDDVEAGMRKLTIMIRDMSKYTILIGVAAITSSIVIITAMAASVLESKFALQLAANVLIMDGIVNIICIAIQFYFFKLSYDKYCGTCHRCCESRYTQSINSQLIKQASQSGHGNNNNNGNNASFLQLKQLDRQGTVGIERVLSKDNLSTTENELAPQVEAQHQENGVMNEPNMAAANMKSFSSVHLE